MYIYNKFCDKLSLSVVPQNFVLCASGLDGLAEGGHFGATWLGIFCCSLFRRYFEEILLACFFRYSSPFDALHTSSNSASLISAPLFRKSPDSDNLSSHIAKSSTPESDHISTWKLGNGYKAWKDNSKIFFRNEGVGVGEGRLYSTP